MNQPDQRLESLQAAAGRALENARQLVATTGELIDISNRLLDHRPAPIHPEKDRPRRHEREDDG